MRKKEPTKKKRILETAIELFAQKGYYNTTIKDISKKTQVADGTVYIYFTRKQKILESIFEKGWREILEKIEPIIQSTEGPWEKFDLLFYTTLTYFKENISLARVLIRESIPREGGLGKKTVIKEWFQFTAVIDTIFRQAQKQGLINEAYDIKVLQQLIVGAGEMATYGWVLGAYTKYKAGYSVEDVRKMTMAMLHGLKTQFPKPQIKEGTLDEIIQEGITGI